VDAKKGIVLIVLVALAMLLVIAIALGADHPARPSSSIDDALQKLKSDRFLRIEGGVTADCADGPTALRLAPGGDCRIVIPGRGLLSRPTRAVFGLAGGAALEIALDPDEGPELGFSLEAGDCSEAAVGRGGGTLTLSGCQAGAAAQCVVDLRDRGC
jgi:hypothetical protein